MNGFLYFIKNPVRGDDVIGFSLCQGYDGVEASHPARGGFKVKKRFFVGDGDQFRSHAERFVCLGYHDHPPRLPHGGADGLPVDRIDGAQVNQLHRDTCLLRHHDRLLAFADHGAEGYQGDVAALLHHPGLVEG